MPPPDRSPLQLDGGAAAQSHSSRIQLGHHSDYLAQPSERATQVSDQRDGQPVSFHLPLHLAGEILQPGGLSEKQPRGRVRAVLSRATLKRGDLHRPAVDQNAPGAKPRTVPEHTNQLGAGRWVVSHFILRQRPLGGREEPFETELDLLLRPAKPRTDGPAVAWGEAREAGILKARSDLLRLDSGLKQMVDGLPPRSDPGQIVLFARHGGDREDGQSSPRKQRPWEPLTSRHEREQKHCQNEEEGDKVSVVRVTLQQNESDERDATNAALAFGRKRIRPARIARPAPGRAESNQ